MLTSATLNPSTTEYYVALPTGYRETVSMVTDEGGEVHEIDHEDLLRAQYNNSASRPEYYSITDQINFDCKAGSTYNYTHTYYKGLDIASDTTNSVLTDYPNIYLYGALTQAEPFLKNDRRMGTWVQLYEAAIKKANSKAKRQNKTLRTEHPSNSSSFDIVRGY